MHHGRPNQYSFVHHNKKIVLHPMSPKAIVQDDVARASKLKSQEHAKSENQIIAKELVKHDKKQNKSVLDKKNEITLKEHACLPPDLILMNCLLPLLLAMPWCAKMH